MILNLLSIRNKSMTVGLLLLFLLVFIAIFSPILSPYNPVKTNLYNNILSPSWRHLFGTDNLGRDVLSRIMYGTRIDFLAGLFIVGITLVVGIVIGIVAGYWGGILDKIIVGIMDTFLSLPELILALVFVGSIGPGMFSAVLALSLVGWVRYARIVRSSVLSLREKEFVEVAKASGASDFYIIIRHILPNVIAPISTLATLHFGHAILSIAALGYLGLGAQPPMPEWGTMLNEGRVFLREAWWLSIFPGLAIMITVLSCNLISDGVRDLLDPRLRRKVVSL
jgi:peptide/nickel transport system permease protein